MGNIKLLDCTLRDGGYINDWNFGKVAIVDIKEELEKSNTEIIELGFIRDEVENEDRSIFTDIQEVKDLIGNKLPNREYAIMTEVSNPYPLDKLEQYSEGAPDIIRVIVWKRMLKEGFEYCKGIVEKGYKLCVQPARVSQYSDEEFVNMIKMFNELNPMAIYVVDSWGTMYKDELLHYLKLADENLKPEIAVGYHGHNNLMQAFEVACAFCESNLARDLIIDSSIYGIGRGAGNLNTELIAKWMNKKLGKNYNLDSFIKIYDKYIKWIYKKEKWGYSVPYFITAKYNANPNFANYYEKKNISVEIIDKCIAKMSEDERIIFKEDVAENSLETQDIPSSENKKNNYTFYVEKQYYKNKLALILITANSHRAVYVFLLHTAKLYEKLGIDLIIFDSSDNNKTEKITKSFSIKYSHVKYDRWNGMYDGFSIDNKVIDAYKKYSNSYEYLWVHRDGNKVLLDKIIEPISQYMDCKKDIIIVNHRIRDVHNLGTKSYNDCTLMFKEQCKHLNTLGTYIVKSSFVIDVINEIPCDERTYGMYFPISFFYYLSTHKTNVASVVGELWKGNIGSSTKSFWTKNILWQWGARWYDMITALPSIYDEYKPEVLKIETYDFKPFSFEYLVHAKHNGGISKRQLDEVKDILPQVCETPIWLFYAVLYCPNIILKHISKSMKSIKKRQYKNKIRFITKTKINKYTNHCLGGYNE